MSDTIDKKTSVTIGVALAIAITVSGGWQWILSDRLALRFEAKFVQVEAAVQAVEEGQMELKDNLVRQAQAGLSDTEMDLWIERYRAMNPNANIPDRPK